MLWNVSPAHAQTDVETVTFGDWERTCRAGVQCVLSQSNADSGSGDIRMRTEISLPSHKQVLMSVVVPNIVILTEGPWLTVDGIFVSELKFVNCQNGCLARVLFTNPMFGLVTGGKRGIVTVSAGGQRIGLVLSMDGLAEGLQSISKLGE